ncbi:hypothetical protein K461DRAFT_103765 [Myriangium duriaei CBS 260.36]|uniref:Uncharacterized protein n=1 Tax=Myriangium duriaei CBS 260.36 TaxID=1168546 RepID=A0A9P4J6B1_9PEZI|nr:hypothetical protein K461DRAFT_103765 [Myriangium duriaei CBS 260.36]
MAKTFFVDWALWQKMVFILGCALFVTILAGLVKLWFVHWRVRKYAALEKIADRVNVIREKSIIRSLSTKKTRGPRKKSVRQNNVPASGMVEVPFGIRALESGTQVEDVWDSRPNSRETSRVDLYRQSNTSTADITRSQPHSLGARDSSGLTTNTESSINMTNEITPAEIPSSERDSAAVLARGRYPPHSFLRYEGTKGHRTTNSFSRRRTSGLDSPQQSTSASTFLSTASNPGSDSEGGGLEYHLRLDRRNGQSQPSSIRSSSTDSIYAMQQRRISQSAETGQILPRLRTERVGSESSLDGSPMDRPRRERRMSFEADANGEDSDSKHFATPSIKATKKSSSVNDDHSSNDRRSRKPKRLRKRSSPAATPPETPTTASSPGFSVSRRRSSEILRQVNPGFAVLKPGSVETSPAPTPMDENNTSRRRSSSTESGISRKGRKLQKKRMRDDERGRSQ